jgi:hypothetical protein
MNKILQITHEGYLNRNYTEFSKFILNFVEHYSDGILETFKLESNELETSLFFEFYEELEPLDAATLLEALQIELMDEYVVNFIETE